LYAACVACVVLAVCYTKGDIVELFMAVRNRHDEKVVFVLGSVLKTVVFVQVVNEAINC